jgi:hypothetical protein
VGLNIATVRTHVILPAEILREIDTLVGQRGRSAFLAEVARQEVQRRKLLALLDREEPAWRVKDHPELKRGAAAWVSKMRRGEQKFRDQPEPPVNFWMRSSIMRLPARSPAAPPELQLLLLP